MTAFSNMPIITDKYNKRVDKVNSLLCVGLDSDYEKLPKKFKAKKYPQFEFNKWIINETVKFAAAYKPNAAFYEARSDKGLAELKMTMDWLRKNYFDVFTILDAKRADIGNTNRGYVEEIFDWLGFDAVTLHPYLGGEALAPFLEREDKGCIILCRTSNPGAGELQDLICKNKPIWQVVAETVRDKWNKNNNCLLVVGATYPAETKKIRQLVGDMTFLMPGIGAQGGDVEAAVKAGINSKGQGLIINSARGIIFADNPAAEAKKLKMEINKYR
jgi:orotidine-5'-phosphate decarboxylase